MPGAAKNHRRTRRLTIAVTLRGGGKKTEMVAHASLDPDMAAAVTAAVKRFKADNLERRGAEIRAKLGDAGGGGGPAAKAGGRGPREEAA